LLTREVILPGKLSYSNGCQILITFDLHHIPCMSAAALETTSDNAGMLCQTSHCTGTNMRATTILAIIAIIALGAVTSLISIHQVSAQGPPKKFPGGGESSSPCDKSHAGQAGSNNPHCGH
jgi:hypothetical protein